LHIAKPLPDFFCTPFRNNLPYSFAMAGKKTPRQAGKGRKTGKCGGLFNKIWQKTWQIRGKVVPLHPQIVALCPNSMNKSNILNI
jgi:hypothetical protein